MNPFATIKDSSVWQSDSLFSAVDKKDFSLRIGIVKRVYRDKASSDLRYLVEVRDRNDAIELNCRLLRQFGGVFNYEDAVYHGYKINDKPDPVVAFDAKAGDVVLVGQLNGEAREAIILGSLTHPARTSTIPIDKGPYYQAEFNGVETVINDSGEYKVTFKAIPTNIKKLDDTPAKKLPKPEYDAKVGGSFFMFDKTGSFEINDKSQQDLQNFRIDKPKGIIEINSGKIKLTMTKKGEKVDLKCKVLNVVADDSISEKTKDYKMEASKSIKMNSPKVAIGKSGVELLDQLAKLVDALAKVTPISPVGPCTALKATPQWAGVDAVKAKIKEITGTL